MTGTRNAAVFPEPVCAHDMRSRRAFNVGIEYFCKNANVKEAAKQLTTHLNGRWPIIAAFLDILLDPWMQLKISKLED